ncbi:MAG: hypothetical protein AVDCRST_MAG78-1981, partial [uncultured Rubrobacteraceae bacterium]
EIDRPERARADRGVRRRHRTVRSRSRHRASAHRPGARMRRHRAPGGLPAPAEVQM